MTEPTNDLILNVMRDVQAGLASVRNEMGELRTEVVKNTHQVKNVAQGMVSLGVQVRRLAGDMETIGFAVDAHTTRLGRIEQRLGVPPLAETT